MPIAGSRAAAVDSAARWSVSVLVSVLAGAVAGRLMAGGGASWLEVGAAVAVVVVGAGALEWWCGRG